MNIYKQELLVGQLDYNKDSGRAKITTTDRNLLDLAIFSAKSLSKMRAENIKVKKSNSEIIIQNLSELDYTSLVQDLYINGMYIVQLKDIPLLKPKKQ